jgi:hypothetical protein
LTESSEVRFGSFVVEIVRYRVESNHRVSAFGGENGGGSSQRWMALPLRVVVCADWVLGQNRANGDVGALARRPELPPVPPQPGPARRPGRLIRPKSSGTLAKRIDPIIRPASAWSPLDGGEHTWPI